MMKSHSSNDLWKIGIKPKQNKLEDNFKDSCTRPLYAVFDIKRLTKANSFIILDEVFYIAKKLYNGKPSSIYHVYRVSDKRYVCPSTLDKEKTIEMVTDKID